MSWIDQLKDTFLEDNRYMWMVEGLGNTLLITIGALAIGVVIGALIAIAKYFSEGNKKLRWVNWICDVYTTVIRGIPMTVLLLLFFFVIFVSARDGVPVAIAAFGINSGAYVSENIRAGILSVDIGQTEAGRALGLGSRVTMMKIVIPQAIKNVIPAIGNELIALIKETSIVSMIGMYDLTQAAKVIGAGNNMASYIVPMSVAACFYLAIVYLLTFAIKIIERKLRAGDKH